MGNSVAAWAARLPVGLRVDRALGLVWKVAPRWVVLSAGLLVIQGLVPLATLYVLKLLVDRLSELSTQSGGGVPPGVFGLIALAFAIAAVGTLSSALLAHANLVQTYRVQDYIQQAVQIKSVAMDLEFYESPRYHDKLHRAQQEAPARPRRIVRGLTRLGRSALALAGSLILLLRFHWGVVAAVIAASVPTLFYRLKYAEAMYQWHREKTAKERLAAYLNQLLTSAEHAKEVRAFGFGSAMSDRFRELRDALRGGVLRISGQRSRKQFVSECAAALAGYGSLALIAYAAIKRSITLGDLVMYFGAFQVALVSLRESLRGVAELYENNLYLSTLYEFLDVHTRVSEPARPRAMPRRWRSGLRVDSLSFRYPGTKRLVLDGIDMDLRAGATVALVGRNGSGKTTLAKLLCRLYDPTCGRITIDGIDIREFRLDDLRSAIGVFFQDFGRYDLTARENIWLGRPEPQPEAEAIEEAAKAAAIHETLLALPRGYDSVLSRSLTDGEELSMGQWQKLALARVILRDAQLVILDEPTSHLDAAAELEFLDSFREIVRTRSALVISHRLSTARLADEIVVLDEGRVIERGTHHQLLALAGLYAELFRKQASYYTKDRQPKVERTAGLSGSARSG